MKRPSTYQFLTTSTLRLLVFALLLPAAAFADPAYNFDVGGTTTLDLTPLIQQLKSAGIDLIQFGTRADSSSPKLKFVLSAGTYDAGTTAFEALHEGGFGLVEGSANITFTGPIVSTTGQSPAVLTVLATPNGTLQGGLTLFDLTASAPPVATHSASQSPETETVVARLQATLSQAGAALLNQTFGTTIFSAGEAVGTVKVKDTVNVSPIPLP